MKVALVHDWLTINGGAEKVLESLLKLYPQADVFTLVDFLPESQRGWLKNTKVKTSFIQKLPFAKSKYTHFFPLFPYAIEQFDLTGYDVVISSSYCAAKGVIIGPRQVHVSYCHSPARYAWDLQTQYLKESGLSKGFVSGVARYFLHKFRNWDLRSSFGVDEFIANSGFIKKRIYKCYKRKAHVIYPPVNLDRFTLEHNKDNYYLAASRLVPYKRFDIIVDAFKQMPDRHLKVIGSGPEHKRLLEMAEGCSNIEILGFVDDAVMVESMRKAKAFVFAAEEDFGIVSVEAQSCGTPVIAYGKGGSLETVSEGVSGLFFPEQTASAVIAAVNEFEEQDFPAEQVNGNAMKFSEAAFHENIEKVVQKALDDNANL